MKMIKRHEKRAIKRESITLQQLGCKDIVDRPDSDRVMYTRFVSVITSNEN